MTVATDQTLFADPLPGDPFDREAVSVWIDAGVEACLQPLRTNVGAGREVAKALSAALDRLLQATVTELLPAGNCWALAVLGDWAWSELTPESSLSLGLFSNDPSSHTESLEKITGLFSSAGLELQTECWPRVEFCADLSDVDLARLLEMRLVAGDAKVFEEALLNLRAAMSARGRRVISSHVCQRLAQHDRDAGTVCRLRPDILTNPGGLADHRMVSWLQRALELSDLPGLGAGDLIDEDDFEDLREAASFLRGCRILLHGLSGAALDRLDRSSQEKLAAALGYRSSEESDAAALLMRDILRQMRLVFRICKAALAPYEEERDWNSRQRTVERRRPLGRDFIRIGKRIYLARPDLFEGRGAALRMMQGFHRAATGHLGFSREFLKKTSDNLYMVAEEIRESGEAARLFLEILKARGCSAEILRAMHESGYLGAYLPAISEIDCLVTGEADQAYTVDEHTLMVIDQLDAMELSGTSRAATVAGTLPVWLLKLAALVHAIGKSRGVTNFAERGALMIPRVSAQLRLEERQARFLVFLTAEQMLLEDVAAQRMTSDERLLRQLAETVGECEYLDALYVLSIADLASLKSEKAVLLGQRTETLYDRLSARLAAAPARSRGRLAEEVAAFLPADITCQALEEHLQLVPERYLLEVAPEEAALHLSLLSGISGGARLAVDWRRRKGHVHAWVLGPDRPRRISQIAGAMLCAGASILSARAYTRSDSIIIDQFDLQPADGGAGSDQFWDRAADTIRQVLTADLAPGENPQLAKLLAGALQIPGLKSDPHLRFDNKISDQYTVMDVSCPDRFGLLYAISAGIADAGADIVFAKISTVNGQAQDVFYLTLRNAKISTRENQRRIRSAINSELRKLG
jgi:[protein-PII] uridylyltransferase